MKQVVIGGALVLFALVAGAYFYFHGKTYEVRLTEAELRDKIESHFPITKSYLLLFEVTLQPPRIALHDGSERVALGIDAVLNVYVDKEKRPLGGGIDVESAIRYESGTGQFFLTDPEITHLDVQGIPEKYVTKVREFMRTELGKQFARYPVYTLHFDNAKTATARLILRRVQIDHGVLVLTLGI
jgi:Protein of unknown function (DUF1439)